jgi:polar amino acid transport system substrate-binding protein
MWNDAGVRHVVRAALCLIALLLSAAGCGAATKTAKGEFEPAMAGRLTVATNLPAPGFWQGKDVSHLDGGFEWGIATELAGRSHLALTVIDVPFGDIVSGNLHGADLALSQVGVTKDRAEHVDFSTGYFTSQAAVVARRGRDLTDLLTARGWTWTARQSTTEAAFVTDVIRPDAPLQLAADEEAELAAVRAGEVDGALMDLPTALVLTNGDADLATVSRFDRTEQYGVVLPKSSANTEAVNKDLASMRADGTLDDLDSRWLEPAFGVDPNDLPVIQTP